MDDQWMQAVGNLGFPIAVAGYCLVTLNRTVKAMNETLIELKAIMAERSESK